MTFKRITAVLFAEEIESAAKFWTERFGFNKVSEVPDGGRLAFVMLQKDGTELMYQSYASAEKDIGAISKLVRNGPTFLYIEVDRLDDAIRAAKGAEIASPERTTFYGAREVSIKDPAGHFITFAEFAQAAAS